jgi:hypothetical protein
MLVAVCDHFRIVEVFIVDDLGLIVKCLHYHLLSIGLQKHILDERIAKVVDIVSLEESIVNKEWGDSEERVADHGGNCWHEHWIDKEWIDNWGVQKGGPQAGPLGQTKVDLLVIHRNHRVNLTVARVVNEM